MKRTIWFQVVAVVSLLCGSLFSQDNPNTENGLKPYCSFHGGDIDSISLTNGNVMLHIPLLSYPQRGSDLRVNFVLEVNSKGWYVQRNGTNTQNYTYRWAWGGSGVRGGGSSGVTLAGDQEISVTRTRIVTDWTDHPDWDTVQIDGYAAVTADGSSHTSDGDTTGIKFTLIPSGDPLGAGDSGTVLDRNGIHYTLKPFSTLSESHYSGSSGPNQYTVVTTSERAVATLTEDRNGNKISGNFFDGDGLGMTDTLGRFFNPQLTSTDSSNCQSPYPISSANVINFPGQSGGSTPIKFCYSNFGINTGSMPGGAPASATVPMLVTAVLANGTKWTFNYDSYGNIAYIGLPTGGSISYGYTTISQCTPFNTFTTSNRAVSSRTVDANDGAGPHTWTYNWAASATQGGMIATVTTPPTTTSPNGDDTVHVIMPIVNTCSLYETETQYFQGTGSGRQLLKTVDTQYSQATGPSGSNPIGQGLNVVPTVITTTLATNGKVSQIQKDYASDPSGLIYGNVTEAREYDYGQGAPGPLLRKTDETMLWQNNSTYLNFGMLDLPFSIVTQDGSGNRVAETDYNYDDYSATSGSPVPSGVSSQLLDTNPPNGLSRGNVTSISRWLNLPSPTTITSSSTYYDTGMVATATDPLGNATTFTYDPAFMGAYVTQTQMPTTGNGIQHATHAWYDFNTGLKISATDQNNQTTTYSYDNMSRVTSVTGPPDPNNGNQQAQTAYGYNDTPYTPGSNTPYAYQQEKIDANSQTTSWTQFDGLGRVIRTAKLNSEASPNIVDEVDTCYDSLGRKQYQTYPYQGPGWLPGTYHCPPDSSTPVGDGFSYDPLGRLTQVTHSDNSKVNTDYSQFPVVTVTDEAGNQRRNQTDALGRLLYVWEPDAAGNFSYETDYYYNALDNLEHVVQKGNDPAHPRQRDFQYDSLSRLIFASNPESGAINYGYDANGNLVSKISPMPNQTGSTQIQFYFHYDELNRLQWRWNYTQSSDPVERYTYDVSSVWGTPVHNPIGRLVAAESDGSTTNPGNLGTVYSYDIMGREEFELEYNKRGDNTVHKQFNYAYNLDGSLNSITYPSGRVVNYSYNAAQRPTSAVDPTNNISFATAAHYTGSGALGYLVNGATASFGGIVATENYNARMQPNEILVAVGAQPPVLDLIYDYYSCNGNGGNNGNVCQSINNKDGSRTQAFRYDQLNRLIAAWTPTAGTANSWANQYQYDPWGNLLQKVQIPNWPGEALNVAVNGNNQVTSWCYDAAGNIVGPNNTCANYASQNKPFENIYDGQNRLTSAQNSAGITTSYDYDADGQRVKKSNGSTNTLYWYGPGGEVLEETDLNGNLTNEYIFFGGKRVARASWVNPVPPPPPPTPWGSFIHSYQRRWHRARNASSKCVLLLQRPPGLSRCGNRRQRQYQRRIGLLSLRWRARGYRFRHPQQL